MIKAAESSSHLRLLNELLESVTSRRASGLTWERDSGPVPGGTTHVNAGGRARKGVLHDLRQVVTDTSGLIENMGVSSGGGQYT
jgi:hypothetical protein